MPSAWSLIDASFPTFTGEERVSAKIPVLLDYMYMLSEGIKYQLANLSSKNWNSTALENLKVETTADLVEQMAAVCDDLSTITNRLSALDALITRMNQVETDIGFLEKSQEEMAQEVFELKTDLDNAEGDIRALGEVVQTDGAGGVTLGGTGKTLNLIGNVYINGKLME